MSWISPSTCSSSGLIGTSLAMAGWLDPLLYPVSCGSRRRRLLCLVRCGAARRGSLTPPFRWRRLVSAWQASRGKESKQRAVVRFVWWEGEPLLSWVRPGRRRAVFPFPPTRVSWASRTESSYAAAARNASRRRSTGAT